jgi:hypothetical protein
MQHYRLSPRLSCYSRLTYGKFILSPASFLKYILTWFVRSELSRTAYICDNESLRNRHSKAYKLHKAGVNLKMLIEMHKSPNLIPPYLHGELLPVTHCMYDASEVGFHRHISYGAEETDTANQDPDDFAASIVNVLQKAGADHKPTPPPETDQLGDIDIRRISGETRSALKVLRRRFANPAHRALGLHMDDSDDDDGLEFVIDEDDDFEVDDLDEDEDMELDLELDEDDDEFEGGDGPIFFEHNGEYYVQMFDSETEDEDDDDEMHDAVETQQPVNEDMD